MAESSRWYCRDGTLAPEEVIGKSTGRPRRVTVKDAKENGWVPSVSTIKDMIRKPALDGYILEQTLQAVMRHPETNRYWVRSLPESGARDDEDWARYKAEIEVLAEEHRNAAADAGTQVHAYIQRVLEGKELPDIDPLLKDTACAMLEEASHLVDLSTAKTEATFVRADLHFAGTPDVIAKDHSGNWVILDWKTQGKLAKKMDRRDDWPIQEGAYSMGALDRIVPGYIICGSTVKPESRAYEYTVNEIGYGWEQFDLMRRLWLLTRMPERYYDTKAKAA